MKFKTFFTDPCAKYMPGVNETEKYDTFTITGAKNEHVGCQIVIEALDDLVGLCVRADPFRSDDRKYLQIDASYMKLYTLGTVLVQSHTENTDNIISQEPGMYPDPLYRCRPISLKRGEVHRLFLTLDIPEYAKPGDYTAYMMLFTSSEDKIVLPIKLHVIDVLLDAEMFDLVRWPNIQNLVRMHGAPVGSDKFWQGMDRVAELLAEYGETMIFIPWNELQIFRKDEKTGEIAVDSTLIRKYIDVFKNRGFRKFAYRHISWRDQWVTKYALGWGLRIDCGSRHEYPSACDFFDPDYLDLITKHLLELQSIAESDPDGCEYYTHIFDEPVKYHNEIYLKLVDFVRGTAPALKLIEAMRSANFETYDKLDACVSLWGTDLELRDRISGRFFWYICAEPKGGYCNRFIDQEPACYRAVPWLMWKYDIKGYLEWAFNFYGDGLTHHTMNFDPRVNPLVTVEVQDPNGFIVPPGDAFLAYPDEERFYMPSLRLEIFMFGLQEYKYLKMLAALAAGGNAEAAALEAEAREFLRDTLEYSKNLRDYDAMKLKIGALLEKFRPQN